MMSFRGYGRTGNYVRALINAAVTAWHCRSPLELPARDDAGAALIKIDPKLRYWDFRNVLPARKYSCPGMKGRAYTFWKRKVANVSAEVQAQINTCIRHYLGLCHKHFCAGLEHLQQDVLVCSVRQGDIFRANFTSDVHAGYWQPPMSYYFSAINFTNPSTIIFVAEPTNTEFSPIWLNAQLLSYWGIPAKQFRFQSTSNFFEDLRVLLCASQRVESRTTLNNLLDLGFAEKIFRIGPCTTMSKKQEQFRIPFRNLHPWHDNQPREWVDLLLQGAGLPQRCS